LKGTLNMKMKGTLNMKRIIPLLISLVALVLPFGTARAQGFNPGFQDSLWTGAELPAKCRATKPAQVFIKTGSSAGVYWCSSADTWSGPLSAATTPGGTNGQIQYNNSGVFGGLNSTGTGNVVRANSPALVTPTGIVKGDVGLGSVDNTSDAAKPVSTAQQAAINLKASANSTTSSIPYLSAANTYSDSPLTRVSANVVAQSNSTTAQTTYFYNTVDTVASPTNYARAFIQTTTTSTDFGNEVGGSSTALTAVRIAQKYASGSGIFFQTRGTDRWQINGAGHLIALAHNTYDFGNGVNADARSIFAGTSVQAPTLVATSALKVKEVTNGTMGTCVLVAGACTVSTTSVTANSRIFLTSQADGGTPGFLRVSARTAAASFTVTSSSGTDTSTVAWLLIEPAP
jgi:hypothetical protein